MGIVTAAVAVAGPPSLPAQEVEATQRGADPRSAPVVSGPDSETAAEPESNTDTAAQDEVRMNQRFNELRSEILDERGKFIERVLMFFGVVIPVTGFLAFIRFRQIERDAREGAKSAKRHSDEAYRLVSETRRIKKQVTGEAKKIRSIKERSEAAASEIDRLLRRTTAQWVEQAPDQESVTISDVTDDPKASATDKAIVRAIFHQRHGRNHEAIELWRAVAVISEENANDVDLASRAWFSCAYLLDGREQEAVAYLDKAIKLNPNFAEAYSNRAGAKIRLGRHQEAVVDCDKAIELDPDLALAYSNRAGAKMGLGLHQEAVADCDKAIELDPDHDLAYYNRGISKAEMGRHQEAIADFDMAIERNPDYAAAYFSRAGAKVEVGRHREAEADCDKAIELDPDLAQAYSNRGGAKIALGRHQDAIADFDKAIKLNPDYAQPYYNRGISKAEMGRHQEAIADFDMAIERNPDVAWTYSSRGISKAEMGRHQEALADFDKAIERNPDYAEACLRREVAKAALDPGGNTAE